MAISPPARTLASLRDILARLEQDRHAYDLVSFAQLKRILHRRMVALEVEVRGKTGSHRTGRRAA